MWKNHLKVAWRTIWNNKLVSGINILGLGLGLMASVFVLLYTRHELSYDQWITDKDNLYRLTRYWESSGRGSLTIPGPAAPALKAEIPGVRNTSRVIRNEDMLIEWNRQLFEHLVLYSVDSTFFQTFPWDFKSGDPATAFQKPNSVVITESLAERIFANANPVGQSLLMETSHLMEVTGVVSTPPGPSHVDADMFLYESLGQTGWTGARGHVYVRLQEGVTPAPVEDAFYELARERIALEYREEGETPDVNAVPKWQLQPVTDIHLLSRQFGVRHLSAGSYGQLSIIGLLGLIILALAIINYVNLSTARLAKRASEVSIRKVVGASRRQLIRQFIVESCLSVVLALGLAITLASYASPFFNEMVSRSLNMAAFQNGSGILAVVILALTVGILAGLVPAYYFSGLNPADTIKDQITKGKKTARYRHGLVILQFTLSIGLILFVSFIWQQINFLMDKELGFQDDQIAVFRINRSETADQFQQKKDQLLRITGVEAATQNSRVPGNRMSNYGIQLQGSSEDHYINTLFIDNGWNETFQLPVVAGRFFSPSFPTDTADAFVVNEAFIRKFQLENPVGQAVKFGFDDHYGTIIGVVKDFHYQNLENLIEPLILSARPDETWMGQVAIRLDASRIKEALPAVAAFWEQLEPGFPPTFEFVDQTFAAHYQRHLHFGRSLLYACIFSIFIALLGLIGLMVFNTQQRTKEIGIRKILGASVMNLLGLLSKDLLRLVLIATLIAVPASWYLMKRWLQNFAFQVEVSWPAITGVGLAVLLITFLPITIQGIRTALANPVDSLHNE